MPDGSDDGTRWSRRGFLATAGSTVFVGSGNATTGNQIRLESTVTVETDSDARRLASALASELGVASGVETMVRTVESETDRPDATPAGTEDGAPLVSVTARGPSRAADRSDSERYRVPLDLAQFVPERTAWYPVRSGNRLSVNEGRWDVESWAECGTDSSNDDRFSRDDLAHLERVRPTRPSGSAGTVFVYGTRAFQYASGFGGRGYYEVSRDRFHSLPVEEIGSIDDGIPVVRRGRVAVNDSALERFGTEVVERVLPRFGAVRV